MGENSQTSVGRSTKCTPDVITNIVAAINLDISRRSAAHIAGISESTMYLWLSLGRKYEKADDEDRKEAHAVYLEFMEAVQVAEAELEKRLVADVQKEPGGAKFLLRTRFRDTYGNHFEIVNREGKADERQKVLWPDQIGLEE